MYPEVIAEELDRVIILVSDPDNSEWDSNKAAVQAMATMSMNVTSFWQK